MLATTQVRNCHTTSTLLLLHLVSLHFLVQLVGHLAYNVGIAKLITLRTVALTRECCQYAFAESYPNVVEKRLHDYTVGTYHVYFFTKCFKTPLKNRLIKDKENSSKALQRTAIEI